MDPTVAYSWKQFFGDGAAAPTAVILLLANIAQWAAARAERARAAKALEEVNKRCIDISASVTSVAQQFVAATQAMQGGRTRGHRQEPPRTDKAGPE